MALFAPVGAAQASDQLLYFEAQGTSQYAEALRDAKFGRQFIGLTLRDFDHDDVISGNASGKVAGIENPALEAATDFKAAIRTTKKTLILTDEFIYSSQSSFSSGGLRK